MTATAAGLTTRERELGAIINAYNEVTERLKQSHERLTAEVTRLREQLDEKNRELARRERLAALGEMAAGVAHEIRNPLQGIQLYANLLAKDLKDSADGLRRAQKICTGAHKLNGIIEDILAFAGELEPRVTAVDLKAMADECLELAAPVATARGVTFVVARDVARFNLRVDPLQLQRALMNLLFNAIDAAGERGTVWLSAVLEENGYCGITVADDGPGVADDLKHRIFNPFFTTKDSGTGLGLAIVHRIAESHGGRVVAADREGGGAAMTLVLPLEKVEEQAESAKKGSRWHESA